MAVVASLLLPGGCGFMPDGEDHAWRQEAERRCLAQRMSLASAYVSTVPSINGPGVCGIGAPFNVQAALDGTVLLTPGATLGCPMVAGLDRWLAGVVQPAALAHYGAPVSEIQVISSYACRTRNNRPGAKLSEHGFGNAVDVAAFTLADGRQVDVESGWLGAPADRSFLRGVHGGACDMFTTVIGPDGDRHHYNHFHLDLARHNASGTYRHCE